jgi:hypothetical protein
MKSRRYDYMYRIYGEDGYPKPVDDFLELENAIIFGKMVYDLFSVKNMKTGNLEYSNFIPI